MKIGIRRLMLRSVFSRLMASFVLIILILSAYNFALYAFYIRNIEREIIVNAGERLDGLSGKLDDYLKNALSVFLKMYADERLELLWREGRLSPYQAMRVVERLIGYREFIPHTVELFIMTEKTDFILSSSGTYPKHRFFLQFYRNAVYSEEFWIEQQKRPFTFNVYETGSFDYFSFPHISSAQLLMPLVFKRGSGADFIIVALVDAYRAARSMDASFTDGFSIIRNDNSGRVLFPFRNAPDDFLPLPARISPGESFKKIQDGYLFSRTSSIAGLSYLKFLPNAEIKSQLARTSSIFVFVVAFAVLLSFAVSALTALRFNRVIQKIIHLLHGSQHADVDLPGTSDLQYVRAGIQKIMLQNETYSKELDKKNSLLQAFLYRSRMKDVHVHISELMEHLTIRSSYALVCFKIHYRPGHYAHIGGDSGKSTLLIKELVQMYLKDFFRNATTFQSENDQILSIVEVDKGIDTIGPFIREILDRMKPEEEYLFFTVGASRVYRDISEIGDVYETIMSLTGCRNPTEETQLLTEDALARMHGKYYFTLEQAEKITNLLIKGDRTACIQEVDEILQHNVKKGVNSFYLGLLCTEFVNCGIKVLTRLYPDLPAGIDVSGVCARLNRCCTIREYQEASESFISEAAGYIQTHEKEKDYIVDYVKEYIEKHYQEEIYLDLLSDKMNLTKAYISAYFKNKTGMNLSDYLKSFRMHKAMELLANTTERIRDIGERVGLGNMNTFLRAFRQYTGKTPSEYRKSRWVVSPVATETDTHSL